MIHVAGGSEPSNATCHGKCFESVAEMLDSCLQVHTVHHIGIEKWQDLDLIAWLCDCVYEQKVFFEKCHKTNIVLHWPCCVSFPMLTEEHKSSDGRIQLYLFGGSCCCAGRI